VNQCTTCLTGFLYNGQCISYCPAGFYQTTDKKCQACKAPCATCSHSETTCSSCVTRPLNYIFGSTCYLECPPGTLPNLAQQICFSCFRPCQTCQDAPSECTSCIPGFLLLGESCIEGAACPNGLFLNTKSNECIEQSECPSAYFINALTHECSEACGINYFGLGSQCVEACPAGYGKNAALLCQQGLGNPLNFSAVLFVKDNILKGTITFNREVVYLSTLSNRSLRVIGGNSSFINNTNRKLQAT
jgi:hypothetical protein